MRKKLHLYLIGLLLLQLTSCVKESVESETRSPEQVAVSFDAYLQQNQETRTTYPSQTGGLTQTELKEGTGFGVFAYYSEDTKFLYSLGESAYSPDAPFNFMYNQQVTWSDGKTAWEYEPVKYWPNNNDPADDKGATGSKDFSYVSFYAYAPHTPQTDHSGDDKADGIISMTANDVDAGKSYITYRTATMKPSKSVDLLWAAQPNLYKTKPTGEGYTPGHVPFNFIHSLSKLRVVVQGLFDHIDNNDTSPEYPIEKDENTKILIKSVTISSPTIYTKGNMYLAPRPDDATTPYWTDYTESRVLLFDKDNGPINKKLLYTANPAEPEDEDDAKDKFDNNLPTGVTHENIELLYEPATEDDKDFEEEDDYYIFLPSPTAEELVVNIVYYVITYDPQLKLNNPRFFSIVENDVTYTSETTFAFKANKRYTLRLQPGLTTVKFDVVEVDEWGSRILLAAEVKDWKTVTREYDITGDEVEVTEP